MVEPIVVVVQITLTNAVVTTTITPISVLTNPVAKRSQVILRQVRPRLTAKWNVCVPHAPPNVHDVYCVVAHVRVASSAGKKI